MPLVSVVINAYNSEAFLAECLQSALAQSFDDIEVIVWDNASIDGTRSIVLGLSDKRVRYFYAPEKVSLYESRVNAAGAAKGDFIAFLDADDLWVVDKLKIQIEAFNSPSVAMVVSDYLEFFDRDNAKISHLCRTYKAPIYSPDQAMKSYKVGMSTLIVRTKDALSVWPASPPPYSYLEDFDMVLRLLSRGSVNPIRKPLALRRKHEKNFSLNFSAQLDEWLHFASTLCDRGLSESQIETATALSHGRMLRIKAQEEILNGCRLAGLQIALKMPSPSEGLKLFLSAFLPRRFLLRRWR